MKKKIAIPVSIVLLLMIMAAIYFFTPKTFGKGVDPSSVDHIAIFDGSTGEGFTVDNAENVKYIVENIQSKPMRRGGVFLDRIGRVGYQFSVAFVDKNDKAIVPIFFLDSDNSIKKRPFLYYCDGGLCIDYLAELENKIVIATK